MKFQQLICYFFLNKHNVLRLCLFHCLLWLTIITNNILWLAFITKNDLCTEEYDCLPHRCTYILTVDFSLSKNRSPNQHNQLYYIIIRAVSLQYILFIALHSILLLISKTPTQSCKDLLVVGLDKNIHSGRPTQSYNNVSWFSLVFASLWAETSIRSAVTTDVTASEVKWRVFSRQVQTTCKIDVKLSTIMGLTVKSESSANVNSWLF